MAIFGKKDKSAGKAAPKAKAPVGGAPPKQAKVKQPKQPKASKPNVPMDIYTLLLGLSALFLIVSTVVLGLNFNWYQSTEPAVLPMSSWK
jgi:hypothetical protein